MFLSGFKPAEHMDHVGVHASDMEQLRIICSITNEWLRYFGTRKYTVEKQALGDVVVAHCYCNDVRVDVFLAMYCQLVAGRAAAIERRLRGKPADLTDPIERVKEHCRRVGAASVRYKVFAALCRRPCLSSSSEAGFLGRHEAGLDRISKSM